MLVEDAKTLSAITEAVKSTISDFRLCPTKEYWFSLNVGDGFITIIPHKGNYFLSVLVGSGVCSGVCHLSKSGWKKNIKNLYDDEDFQFPTEEAALELLESIINGEEW